MSEQEPTPLEQIYRDSFRELRRYAERIVGLQAAEDVVHDVFIGADFSRVNDARAYLLRAVHNRSLQYLRRHDVSRKVDVELWDAAGDSVEDQLLEQEQRQRLRDAIARLPARRRRTIVLRFFQKRRVTDVCHVIGVSEGTMRHDIARSLESIHRKVK